MPPPQVLRVTNPILATLLRARLHRLVSGQLMLLKVTGRRTGRPYSIVVGRHQTDDTFLVSASGRWRHNLRGGAPVVLVVDGEERRAHAELVEDPDRVAEIYHQLIQRVGVAKAGKLGLRISAGSSPTVEDVKPAVAARGIVRARLISGRQRDSSGS